MCKIENTTRVDFSKLLKKKLNKIILGRLVLIAVPNKNLRKMKSIAFLIMKIHLATLTLNEN